MDDEYQAPGRAQVVIGAAFCSVIVLRLPMELTGHPCPETWQWIAAATGACAMIASMVWRKKHPKRVKKS